MKRGQFQINVIVNHISKLTQKIRYVRIIKCFNLTSPWPALSVYNNPGAGLGSELIIVSHLQPVTTLFLLSSCSSQQTYSTNVPVVHIEKLFLIFRFSPNGSFPCKVLGNSSRHCYLSMSAFSHITWRKNCTAPKPPLTNVQPHLSISQGEGDWERDYLLIHTLSLLTCSFVDWRPLFNSGVL